jgi:hypothetical protein
VFDPFWRILQAHWQIFLSFLLLWISIYNHISLHISILFVRRALSLHKQNLPVFIGSINIKVANYTDLMIFMSALEKWQALGLQLGDWPFFFGLWKLTPWYVIYVNEWTICIIHISVLVDRLPTPIDDSVKLLYYNPVCKSFH